MKTFNDFYTDFDHYFIDIAELVSRKSKDRSTKVGAVVVGPEKELRSSGYNGFVRKANDNVESRHQRPTKYAWVAHGELNAILNAARNGVSLLGCTLYMNFEPIPCSECTKAIIQSGITEIVGPNRPFAGKGTEWKESMSISTEMLDEVGVKRRVVDWT